MLSNKDPTEAYNKRKATIFQAKVQTDDMADRRKKVKDRTQEI